MAKNEFEDKKKASEAGKKSKRGPSEKTKLWNELKSYICNEGAEKFKKEIMSLEGKEFLDKFGMILEYFKPKLARTDNKTEITISELDQLLEAITNTDTNPVNE